DFLKLGAEYDTKVGADFLDFKKDTLGVAYHYSVGNWQRAFGYNDVYDEIFQYSTDMKKSKHRFDYNGIEYVLWLWRGDYWNLQSGAEMGLYVYDRTKNGQKHYDVVDFEVPMTMSLYNRTPVGVDNVFCWVPSEDQWWVTGFNGSYTEPNPDNMVTISSIDLSSNMDMYIKAKEYMEDEYENLIFDDSYYTIWVVWDKEGE
ncbi:MAG: DUF4474 domain-containing protein, partial [Lachnospiraceae bacterium]|nr:DUF4474 domain-containing protein [Lachnospiraceae bacterium]